MCQETASQSPAETFGFGVHNLMLKVCCANFLSQEVNMKKFMCLVTLILIVAVAFTACGNNDDDTGAGNETAPPSSNETTGNQTETTPSADEEPEDDFITEDVTGVATQLISDVLAARTPVTITYANWNIMEPQEMPMIEEFMRRYDFITVEVLPAVDPDNSHIQNLHAWSMAGMLPDVFAVSQVPEMLATGFLRDIRPYGQQFDDWVNVPEISLRSAEWRGRIFAMPFSSHYTGFVVNDDLWDANNLPRLEIGFSLEQFLSDLRTITDIPNGIGGTTNWVEFARSWLPNYFNNNFGPHTWDGERLHLNSSEYIESINFVRTLRDESLVVQWGWLPDDVIEVLGAGWNHSLTMEGRMAAPIEGSWWMGWFTELYQDGLNLRYVGLPGNTVALTPTYAGISIQSQNPAVAMLFLNWMAFGEEGLTYRLDLRDNGRGNVDEDGNPITYSLGWMPATVNPTILRRFFDGEVPGIEEAMLANMHNAVIEGEAIIPGHVQALFSGNTGLTVVIDGELRENASVSDVVWSAVQGYINFADFADDVNEFANRQVQQMRDEINFMLDMMGFDE